jgi:putative ABC transport system permease protein
VIAGTAIVFAVVHAVLLKPLPFADPERLVWIWATRTDRDKAFFSIPDFLDYERGTSTLQDVAAYASWGVNLTGGDRPERLQGAKVTTGALSLLGVPAAAGRVFVAEDGTADRVVVLSDALWSRRFGRARDVVGSRVQLNGEDYEVIGVLPQGFLFPGLDAELYAPLSMQSDARRLDRGTNFLRVFGRLASAATVTQVSDEWGRIARELRDAYPEANAKKTEPRVFSLAEELLGPHRPALTLLMGAVLAVWLLACTNILNLQLIRLVAREREGAIRSALGASAVSVTWPYLLENLMLVCAGGLLGTGLAISALPLVLAAVPVTLPRATDIEIDPVVVIFTFAVVGATAILIAVLPVVRYARRRNLEQVLRGTAANAGTSPSRTIARNGLVVFEIAAALCLLVSTALLLKAYHGLQSSDPGVRPQGVVQTRVSLPVLRYADQPALERFLMLASEELQRAPGISRVAAANALPLSAQNIRTDFTIVGVPSSSRAEVPGAQNRWVTAGYFDALGIDLVAGRTFTDADVTARAPVAVVDEALATRFWPDGRAIGTQIRILDGTPDGRRLDVIGVVRNVAHFDIGESPLGTLYGPVHQLPPQAMGFFVGSFMIAVNTSADPEGVGRTIAEAVRRIDPDVPLSAPISMSEQLNRILAPRRFVAVTLAIFAAAALLLAVSGVYSVVSAAAREQTRELAIRLALGASRQAMLKSVLGVAANVLSIGVPLGLAAAAFMVRSVLPGTGVRLNDWSLWMLAPAGIAGAALVASYVRARRVLRLDPAVTLRSE